jgi:flagellar assembly protein FliH
MSNSGFVIGMPSRQDAAAAALSRTQAEATPGFTPAELIARIEQAFGAGSADGPRHYSPADPDANPTEGWDPLDADAAPSAYIDPVEAARTAAYEEGYAAAMLAAREEAERDRALLAGLTDALKAGGAIDRDQLAQQLRRTVTVLVERLVGDIGVSADLLARRVAAATELLADAAESAMLRVHPDDVALLGGALPDTVFAVGDAAVARGSFVLEAASTIVEDGPALWLEQLTGAIDRVALPAC